MVKLKIMVFAIIAVTFLSASAFCADNAAVPSSQRKGWSEKREASQQQLYKELNLTDEQKKVLDENKTRTKEEMKVLYQQMQDKRAILRQELQNDTLDMRKINQINGELKDVQVQILDKRLSGILEVRKILTADQFKKFMTEMQKRSGQHKNKR